MRPQSDKSAILELWNVGIVTKPSISHRVKSVQTWGFSGPYFAVFGHFSSSECDWLSVRSYNNSSWLYPKTVEDPSMDPWTTICRMTIYCNILIWYNSIQVLLGVVNHCITVGFVSFLQILRNGCCFLIVSSYFFICVSLCGCIVLDMITRSWLPNLNIFQNLASRIATYMWPIISVFSIHKF